MIEAKRRMKQDLKDHAKMMMNIPKLKVPSQQPSQKSDNEIHLADNLNNPTPPEVVVQNIQNEEVDDRASVSRKTDKSGSNHSRTKDPYNRYHKMGNMEFNLGNYTSEDMTSLTMITTEMNRRMELTRGMKRGRKVQGFADYCQKTTERINTLKNMLRDPEISEDKKKQLRN